jgi:hypothetical protein
MATPRDLLLIDAGDQPLQVLTGRLKRLGFRVIPVKTPEAAGEVICDPRFRVGAAILPPDLPVANLRGALASLRGFGPRGELTFLATGPRPAPAEQARLRGAGVRFGLWDPVDSHTLRFLVNYALADQALLNRERRTLRAPTDWPVQVRTGRREKDARVYAVSAGGAYLATERPLMRKSLVHLSLPLPTGAIQATARVVMTNVPGNLMRRNLPVGMGVSFTATPVEHEAALQMYAEDRFRQLEL